MRRHFPVDLVAVLALLGITAAVLWPAYQTPWLFVCMGGFGLAGSLLALLAAARRWGVGLTAAATAVVWFLLGTPLVMPSAATAAVLPSLRSLAGLATGPVTAWRDMLTLEPPIGETGNLLAVPGLLALVPSVLAASVSLRTGHPQRAWLPLGVGYLVAAAVGAAAWQPIWLGAAFFVVVLVWTSLRGSNRGAGLAGRGRWRPLRALLGVATLVVAGAVVWAALPVLSPGAARTTARQAVLPPINTEQYSSPLQLFRGNITKYADETLFEVSGLSEGDLVRVATMDTYDGMSFRVATTDDKSVPGTTFTRVGQWIADDTHGVDGTAFIRVRNYSGVWVPTIGRTTGITFDGPRAVALSEDFFYNRSSGTGVVPVGLRDGDSYGLGVRRPFRPNDEQIKAAGAGRAVLPDDTGVPDQLRNLAHEWSDGVPTAGAQVLALEEKLREGYFSHGQPKEALSLPGHSAARLVTLVNEPTRMVGDDEQYAVAMTLMARELGIPARVVYGYRATQSASISGEDVAAWVEVDLDRLGWVVFNPTPDHDRVLQDEDIPPPPRPRPHIDNPPPPPQRPDKVPEEEELPIDPGEPPAETSEINWAEIGAWIALAGVPILGIVVPLTLVLGLKLRRRTRRRKDPLVANRVAGAWAEVVDKARDLGRSPSPAATRSEQAEQMLADFPRVQQKVDPVAISRQADWIVFAPGDPSEQLAGDFWQTSRAMERGIRRSVAWPRWVLSRLSTRSFRTAKVDQRRPRRARRGGSR